MATLVDSPPAAPPIDDIPPPTEEQYPAGQGKVPPPLEDDMMGELTMEELKEVFRLFDSGGDGFITLDTFKDILRELDDEWTEDDICGICADIDIDGSGTIDFEEFVKIMT